uniref:Uncharacterized protein n=1 Tax=Anopheles braziliensis TaxID=58242 RepID=A0A2M3ZK53_9DIPT
MNARRRRSFDELCKNVTTCTNPMGLKCEHRLCKTCCRSKCYREDLDCPGHKIRIKSRRDKAKALTLAEQQQQQQLSSDNGTQPTEQHALDVAVVDMIDKAEALS